MSALGDAPHERARALVERSGVRVAVVVYDFARRAELSALSAMGLRLTRGPLRLAQLGHELRDWMAPAADEAPLAGLPLAPPADELGESAPERLFSDAQIARLGEMASPVDCECPNHLSAIIQSLVAFERYSHQCESRSPADARLHQRLAVGTGHARHLIESLLREVCDQDGIEL
jgi:hypothetical protein